MTAKNGRTLSSYHVRWMIRRDMLEVLEIDEAAPFPMGEEGILRALRQRNCIGMVVELGERVVGFMIYELHKKHLEVVRLVVHPRYRRDGAGTVLFRKLANKLSYHRRRLVLFDVPDLCLDMHLFLRQMGAVAVDIIRQGADDGSDIYRFINLLAGQEDV